MDVALGAKSGGFRGVGGGGTSPDEAPVPGGGGEPLFGAGGRSAAVVEAAVSATMEGVDRKAEENGRNGFPFLSGGSRLGADFWAPDRSQGGSPGGLAWGIIRFQSRELVVP